MRAVRCRPGSVRGQITLLTAAVAVLTLLTLLVAGAGMYSMDHARTARWQEAPRRAVPVADGIHPGTAPGRSRSRDADLGRTRTVARGHRLAASPASSPAIDVGSLPGRAIRRSPCHREQRTRTCEPRLPASGSSGSAASPVYAAGSRAAGFLSSDSRHLILVIEALALISLATCATWKVTGWVLRPVDVARSELAVIGFGDLHTRISEPANAREVARLCRTINNALQRLDEGKEELQSLEVSHRRFASDVSHELRTPIAGLRAQLEEAQQDLGGVRLPDLVETMLGQVERLQTITDDLLFLARMGTGEAAEPQQLDLAALVRTEVSQRSDRRPVQLHLEPGGIVSAVPTQLGRLLANLLDNAQRHCAHQVCVDVHATHAVVELAVSDDGPGIAPGDRERVFHRLTRLDDARRLDRNGTGLGLAIARDIAHAHHGTLDVEESTTGGACFVLRLPRVPPRERGSS
ncbi:HAMP domain-containing sensor histidine kinase [Streptosporangium sp. NPDC023963]|uniref:sensor histidine kinase n=1 Tax=Streptosporangium sp. NPDC023963 TaxID=3155608 RepID=UPI00342E7E5C